MGKNVADEDWNPEEEDMQITKTIKKAIKTKGAIPTQKK